MNPHEHRFQSPRQSFERMPLLIGATPYTPWEALEPVAKYMGWTDRRAPAELSTWLEKGFLEANSESRFLLLHARPERALASAMQQGEAPERAFKQWYRSALDLLEFYRLNPENSVVVEVETALSDPGDLMLWLSENRPEFLSADVGNVQFRVDLAQIEVEDPLAKVLASQTVVQHPEVQQVLNELEAASIPVGDTLLSISAVELDSLFEKINDDAKASKVTVDRLNADRERLEQELAQVREENKLLLAQLHKTQEELESAFREKQALKDFPPQQDQFEALKAEQEQSVVELKQENELLLIQLHKTQEELEQKFYELKAQEQKSADSTVQNDRLQESQQMLDNARQENELLLIQLHNVQEELERYYLSSKEHSDQKRRADELDKSVAALTKENMKLTKERRQLIYDVHQAKIQLAKRSFKGRLQSLIQLPVKAVRRLSPKSRRVAEQLKLVRESGLFDDQWYLENNPDIQGSAIDPLVHFVLYGGQEGRSPSLRFSSKWYLDKYKDVAEAGVNPLVHYLSSGKAEGRRISPGTELTREK